MVLLICTYQNLIGDIVVGMINMDAANAIIRRSELNWLPWCTHSACYFGTERDQLEVLRQCIADKIVSFVCAIIPDLVSSQATTDSNINFIRAAYHGSVDMALVRYCLRQDTVYLQVWMSWLVCGYNDGVSFYSSVECPSQRWSLVIDG